MLEYDEKRNYPRMALDCPASFQVADHPQTHGAVVKNLSGGGVLLWIDGQVQPEQTLSIKVAPPNAITPPMRAEVRVLRCVPVDGADGQFAVACVMERLID